MPHLLLLLVRVCLGCVCPGECVCAECRRPPSPARGRLQSTRGWTRTRVRVAQRTGRALRTFFFFSCSPRSALMRSSFGFSMRFTSANFRVFFALPMAHRVPELPRARDIRASTVGDSCNAGGSGRPARRGASWDHHARRVRAPSDLPARAPCCGGGQCGGFDVAVIACGAGVELLRFVTLCLPVCPRCCIGRLAQYRNLPRSASRALQHVPAGDVSPRLRPRALPVPPVCGSCLAPNVTPSTNACVCSRACACSRAHESAAIWDVRLRAGLQDWF